MDWLQYGFYFYRAGIFTLNTTCSIPPWNVWCDNVLFPFLSQSHKGHMNNSSGEVVVLLVLLTSTRIYWISDSKRMVGESAVINKYSHIFNCINVMRYNIGLNFCAIKELNMTLFKYINWMWLCTRNLKLWKPKPINWVCERQWKHAHTKHPPSSQRNLDKIEQLLLLLLLLLLEIREQKVHCDKNAWNLFSFGLFVLYVNSLLYLHANNTF